MNFKTLQGYVLVILAGIVLVAAGLLMILNGGIYDQFSVFGRQPGKVNVGLLMLLCALGGVVLLYCLRLLIVGMRAVRQGRERQQQRPATEHAESSET
jgi:uncharacterized membrane protein